MEVTERRLIRIYRSWIEEDNIKEFKVELGHNYQSCLNNLLKLLLQAIREENIQYQERMLNIFKFLIKKQSNLQILRCFESKINTAINLLDNMSNPQEFKENLIAFRSDIRHLIKKINNKAKYDTVYTIIFINKDYRSLTTLVSRDPYIFFVTYNHDFRQSIIYKVVDKYLTLNEESEDLDYFENVINIYLSNWIAEDKLDYSYITKIIDEIESSTLYDANRKGKLLVKLKTRISNKNEIRKMRSNKKFKYKALDEIKKLYLNNDRRIDLRNLLTISIDGDGTECIDDAFSMINNDDGTYRIYIHITDIPSIIPYNSYLDKEALQRGETTYFRDNNINMFPNYVAYNIGSLVPNMERNTISLVLDFDSNYKLLSDKITLIKSRIINDYALSYEEVDDLLNRRITNCPNALLKLVDKLVLISLELKDNNVMKEEYRKVQNLITGLVNPTKLQQNESININTSLAANIVQELMVLYNHLVAMYYHDHDLPCLYRCLENFDLTAINNVFEAVSSTLRYRHNIEQYKKMLLKLNTNYLDANYTTLNIGHAGLNLKSYAHATSPARRYSDVIIQRLDYSFIFTEPTIAKIDYWANHLPKIANHLNEVKNINFGHSLILSNKKR